MFTPQRIETIKAKIHVSSLLTDQEKSDWLGLIDLMNDKQLGELEEILSKQEAVAPAVAPTPAPVSPPAPATPAPKPASTLPPLTHLANVPNGVSAERPGTIPTPPVAPPATPVAPTPTPATPTQPAQPEKSAAPLQSKSNNSYKLEHPEDLKELTARDLSHYDLQSLVNAIKTAIAEHGYFSILQLLEQSSLYDSYIKAGEMRLKGLPGDLSQSEFEFMTDLLSHMRFNRW